MIKKTITYNDYNGNERTEDFYFNLSRAEAMNMQMSVTGGLDVMLDKIVSTNDIPQLIHIFSDIILKAYGIKSPDGKRFMKSEEISKSFEETEAFSELYMDLLSDAKVAAEFINGILPKLPDNK